MKRLRKAVKRSTMSKPGILGRKGLNLVENVVLQMHSRWISSGAGEVGIDGYIEFFDSGTGRSFGTTIAVQARHVSEFLNEDPDSLDYLCQKSDLDYWISGNMPVILVVTRPSTKEAYWIDVKGYFSNRADTSDTRVHFVKSACKFVPESFHELIRVGESVDSGLYLAPLPKTENLISNLLPLDGYPPSIYIAKTELRKTWEVWGALQGKDRDVSGAWLLRDGQIVSFHNLSTRAWSNVCVAGTVKAYPAAEWANSGDSTRQREFVQLCNQALQYCQNDNIKYWPDEDCFAYAGSLEEGTVKVSYRSLRHQSRISTVTKYEGKGRNHDYKWLRHMAFRGQFRRLDGKWYLEVTPTYRFTKDGKNLERFHEERLRAMKRSEGNRTVLSALLFWADMMSAQRDLFNKSEGMLRFGRLIKLESNVGISDSEWSERNPDADRSYSSVPGDSFLPFEGKEV